MYFGDTFRGNRHYRLCLYHKYAAKHQYPLIKKFLKEKQEEKTMKMKEMVRKVFKHESRGIDGLLVTLGLCIVAILLCVIMKDSLSTFITTIISSLTTKAQGMLG